MDTRKDSPSEKVKPGPEKTLNHEQLLKLRKDMLDKKYPNQMIAAEAYGVKQKTVSRCLTEYSKDAGLLPIRRKRGASRRTDSNQPQIYDTGLGFINTFDAITPESKAFGDEFPIFYGEGDHSNFCYAESGDSGYVDRSYKYVYKIINIYRQCMKIFKLYTRVLFVLTC